MRQRKALIPLAMTGMLVLPQTGWAQDYWSDANDGWGHADDYVVEGFIGGGAGYYRLEDDNFLDESEGFDDDELSWKIFGGLDFAKVFALEVAYLDFGETSVQTIDIDADGWTVAGLLAIPLTPHFAPYGKVGMLYWDADAEINGVSGSDSGEDGFFGVGARFTISKQSDVRIEYERFKLDDVDLDLASVNFQLRF